MALWHDPLDELIIGLEQALPHEVWDEVVPFEVFCLVTDVLLFGTPEEWEQFQSSSEAQRVASYFDRIAQRNAEGR